jgi:hypothetical protein
MTNHERFAETFKPFAGRDFTTAQIKTMLKGIVSEGTILPNDHAAGNKNPCRCANTDDRIFDRIKRGLYRVR